MRFRPLLALIAMFAVVKGIALLLRLTSAVCIATSRFLAACCMRCNLLEGQSKLHFLACRFLYLDELGASKHLMSISLFLTCAAEVPIFHYAGTIIERLGLSGSVSLILGAFVVRLGAYSTMSYWPSLWLVLFVEPLHGLTFGLAWATGTAFAKQVAPSGLEATMQSAFSSSYFGLGTGLGGLLGGWTYQQFGPAQCFAIGATVILIGSVVASVCEQALPHDKDHQHDGHSSSGPAEV